MAQQISHDFIPLFTKTIQVNGQQVQIPDIQSLQNTIKNLKAAVDGLSGRGTGQTQQTGPLHMNDNVISGIVNTASPVEGEAVSFGLAQQQYTVYRPTSSTVATNYQIQATDGHVRVQASQLPVNQQLPPASTVIGKVFTVKKVDPSANTVYVTTSLDPVTGKQDQIDGLQNFALATQYKYVAVKAVQSGIYDVVANN